MIGVCWNAVMRWEGGTRVPGVTAVPAIIGFLGYDPRPEPENFAEWLKWLRATLGLNQPGLASRLDVPAGTLRAWEKGLYEPNAKRMRSIKDRANSILDSAQPRSSASRAVC
jgi:DNA-binding XRE family transcriptional regulator